MHACSQPFARGAEISQVHPESNKGKVTSLTADTHHAQYG